MPHVARRMHTIRMHCTVPISARFITLLFLPLSSYWVIMCSHSNEHLRFSSQIQRLRFWVETRMPKVCAKCVRIAEKLYCALVSDWAIDLVAVESMKLTTSHSITRWRIAYASFGSVNLFIFLNVKRQYTNIVFLQLGANTRVRWLVMNLNSIWVSQYLGYEYWCFFFGWREKKLDFRGPRLELIDSFSSLDANCSAHW